jgi:hypothetical protein
MSRTPISTGTIKTVTVPGTSETQTFSETPSTYTESKHVDSASWTGPSEPMSARQWIDRVQSQYDHIVVVSGRSGRVTGQSVSDDGHFREDTGMYGTQTCTYSNKVRVVDARNESHANVVNRVAGEIGSAPTTGRTLVVKNWCWSDI